MIHNKNIKNSKTQSYKIISKDDTIRKNIEDLENEQNVFEELLEKNVLERAELDFIDQLKKQYIKDHLGKF